MNQINSNPDHSSFLSGYLDDIINKKVNTDEKLNSFEKVVDFLYSAFSEDYNDRYEELKNRVGIEVEGELVEKITKTAISEHVVPDFLDQNGTIEEIVDEKELTESEEGDLDPDLEGEEFLEDVEITNEYMRLESLDFDELVNRDEMIVQSEAGFIVNLTHHKVETRKEFKQLDELFDRFLTIDNEIVRLDGMPHGALSGHEEKIIVDQNHHAEFPFVVVVYSFDQDNYMVWLVGLIRSYHDKPHYYTKIAQDCQLPKEYARIKSVGSQHTPLLDLTEKNSLSSHHLSNKLEINHRPVIFQTERQAGSIKIVVSPLPDSEDYQITEYYPSSAQTNGYEIKWIAKLQPDNKTYRAQKI